MPEMPIAWVVVTYGNATEAETLIASVGSAPGLRFLVVGNKEGDAVRLSSALGYRLDVSVISSPHNPGYLGALAEISHRLRPEEWVLLSNADMVADPGFIATLRRHWRKGEGVAMIAPSIPGADGRDQNPNLLAPPSARKLRLLERIHRWPWVADLVGLRRRGHSSRSIVGVQPGQEIYAGHGSCFVFTPTYRRRGGRWNYPCRLFGEELWCASEVARIGAKWIYAPDLVIRHHEHSTTGSQRRRGRVAEWKHESLVYWAGVAEQQMW